MNASVRIVAVAAATAVSLLAGTVSVAQAGVPRSAPADDAIRVATYNVMKLDAAVGEVVMVQASRRAGQHRS